MKSVVSVIAAGIVAISAPASAKVTASSDNGFATQDERVVGASPQEVWAKLTDPAQYWNPEHSWSLDGDNLTMDARAGGCFCEAVPAQDGKEAGDGQNVGSVEHARVIYASPGEMLRMRGSLGPLQGEALTGTLTISLIDMGGSTAIIWEYVVGGYSRFTLSDIAGAVDAVQTEQLERLAALFPAAAPQGE